MKIGFIMYNWNMVDPTIDSTLRLIQGAAYRGHTVSIMQPNTLSMSEGKAIGYCRELSSSDVSMDMFRFYAGAQFTSEYKDLADFDIIFMRDDPPVNFDILSILDVIKEEVFIVNDVDGMRRAANKLYPASYYDESYDFVPKTYISKDIDYLQKVFVDSNQDKMILKPLDGFGGCGVIVVDKNMHQNMRSLIEYYIHGKEKGKSEYIILQDYVAGAEEGDVRVLMLNGEAIGAMKRVPAKGENRSNISAGGTAKKHRLTEKEKAICRAIGPKLVADGLHFVGIDIIGDQLIEINVSSPGGIPEINEMAGLGYTIQEKVIEYVESVVERKQRVKFGSAIEQ